MNYKYTTNLYLMMIQYPTEKEEKELDELKEDYFCSEQNKWDLLRKIIDIDKWKEVVSLIELIIRYKTDPIKRDLNITTQKCMYYIQELCRSEYKYKDEIANLKDEITKLTDEVTKLKQD